MGELTETTDGGEKRIFKILSAQPPANRVIARIPLLFQLATLNSSIQACSTWPQYVLSISRHSLSRTEHRIVAT